MSRLANTEMPRTADQAPTRTTAWLAHWGVFLLAAGLGALLLATSIHSYLRSGELTGALVRGEAETLAHKLGQFMRSQGPPDNAKLSAFLEQYRDLEYVAIIDREGHPEFEAGHAGPLRPAPGARTGLVHSGERVRAIQVMRGHGPSPTLGPAPRPSHIRRRHPPPPRVSLIFKPTLARDLAARAQRDLYLGLVYSGCLLLGASVFGRIRRSLDQTRDQLEQSRRLSLVGQMSATLAHELQNPIAGLKGHAQLLGEQLEGQDRLHQKAMKVVGQARRLEGLVENLLAFLRSGKVAQVETELAGLCRQAVADQPASNYQLDLSGAPETWVLDPVQIGQVLENLVRNALQAGGAPVEISVVRSEGQLELLVEDRGAGLPEGGAEQIFEPFFTTKTTGVGLGLSVARRVVELHGGQLGLSPRPGGGTTARIRLPNPGELQT